MHFSGFRKLTGHKKNPSQAFNHTKPYGVHLVLAMNIEIKEILWSPASVISLVVLLETEAQRQGAMWGQ